MEALAGIGIVPAIGNADSGKRDVGTGGEVPRTEVERLQPGSGLRDLLDVYEPCSALDLRLERDGAPIEPHRLLDLAEERTNHDQILRSVDLGDDDQTQTVACRLDNL